MWTTRLSSLLERMKKLFFFPAGIIEEQTEKL
jgi:hypothetical protein